MKRIASIDITRGLVMVIMGAGPCKGFHAYYINESGSH